MGSKRKTYVSSQVWNLAGAVKDRPEFKKITIISGVLDTAVSSMGNHLSQAYGHGPAMKLRSYQKWCLNSGYSAYMELNTKYSGVNLSSKTSSQAITNYLISQNSSAISDSIRAEIVELGYAQTEWFIEKYLTDNYPNDIADGFEIITGDSSGNPITLPADTYRVKLLSDGSIKDISVNVPSASSGEYLFIKYYYSEENPYDEIIVSEGDEDNNPDGYSEPSTSGHAAGSLVYEYDYEQLLSKLHDHEVFDPETGDLIDAYWTAEDIGSGRIYSYYRDYVLESSAEIVGADSSTGQPVTKKEMVRLYRRSKVITESLGTEIIKNDDGEIVRKITTRIQKISGEIRKYKKMLKLVTGGVGDIPGIVIYKIGSGNSSLDALTSSSSAPQLLDGFFPPIPLRHEKKVVPEGMYAWAEKAYKKATSAKYSELQEKLLEDSEAIADVDYVYLLYGVSLNTTSKLCRRYIYEFFKNVDPEATSNSDGINDFLVQWEAAKKSYEDYQAWALKYNLAGGSGGSESEFPKIPPPPEVLPYPKVNSKSLVYTAHPNFRFQIKWSGMSYSSGSGKYEPGCKKGDVFVIDKPDLKLDVLNKKSDSPGFIRAGERYIETLVIACQETDDTWGEVTIVGLEHLNYVYRNTAVSTTTSEALREEVDEDTGTGESSFLVPLSDTLLRKIGLVKSTQIASESLYIVLSSYKIVKKKWYQTGFFQVVVAIAYVAYAVSTGDFASGTSIGIFGTTSATVAALTAIGVSAAMAAVVGVIVNMLVATVISSLIVKASVAAFGEELGSIIGTVAAIVVTTGFEGSTSFDASKIFNEFMKAPNLVKSTMSISSEYSSTKAKSIYAQSSQLMSQYASDMESISLSYKNMFGSNISDGTKDLVNMMVSQIRDRESPSMFLNRTLMTGHDIAEVTHSQISNFAKMNLTLTTI